MSSRMIVIAVAALVVASVGLAGEAPWWDMENCAMCKSMNKPELMENICWEQHNISNGFVSVTVVPDEYLEMYRAAHAEMEKTAHRLQSGEMLPLCGSCTALGMCMMKGVAQEYVETSTGDVWIVTSSNPEVVAELHAWVNRNAKEMQKAKSKEG
jgi:hypothetical protein